MHLSPHYSQCPSLMERYYNAINIPERLTILTSIPSLLNIGLMRNVMENIPDSGINEAKVHNKLFYNLSFIA